MIRLPWFKRRASAAPSEPAAPVSAAEEAVPVAPEEPVRLLKILYIPALHGVLEYDELTTLTGEGHRVFSLGDHWLRSHPVSNGRDSKPAFFDDEFAQMFIAEPGCSRVTRTVTPAFCRNFDVVVVSGADTWLFANIDSLGDVPVVYRTIGQSNIGAEAALAAFGERVRIVRYSPAEIDLPGEERL